MTQPAVPGARAGFPGETLELVLKDQEEELTGGKGGGKSFASAPASVQLSVRARCPPGCQGLDLHPAGSVHAALKAHTKVTQRRAGDKLENPAGLRQGQAGLTQCHRPCLPRETVPTPHGHPAQSKHPLGNHSPYAGWEPTETQTRIGLGKAEESEEPTEACALRQIEGPLSRAWGHRQQRDAGSEPARSHVAARWAVSFHEATCARQRGTPDPPREVRVCVGTE